MTLLDCAAVGWTTFQKGTPRQLLSLTMKWRECQATVAVAMAQAAL